MNRQLAVILFFSMWAMLPIAQASEGVKIVVLIEQEGTASNGEGNDLASALEAHLVGYNIAVEQELVSSIPPSPEELKGLDSLRTLEKEVLAIVWIDLDHQGVFTLVEPNTESSQLFERKLPIPNELEPSDRNAIASAIRSTLSQWLESDPNPAEDKPEPKQPDPKSSLQLQDSEEPPFMKKPPPPEPQKTFKTFVLAGYTFLLSGGTAAFQHGPQLGLGLVFAKYSQIDLSMDIMRPVRANPQPEDRKIELAQLPIQVMLGGVLPYKDFEFGIRVGLILRFFDVDSTDNGIWADKLGSVSPGFASSIFSRWQFTDLVALYLDANIDILGSDYEYTETGSDEINIRLSMIQCNISMGFAVFFN